MRADPLVQAVLARFPGAEIVDVRKGGAPASAQGMGPQMQHDPLDFQADEGADDNDSARIALAGREDG